MFCHKCGHKLIDGSEYCSYCGAKISVTENNITYSDEEIFKTTKESTIPVQEVIGELGKLDDDSALNFEETIVNAKQGNKVAFKDKIADTAVSIVSFMTVIFMVALLKVFGGMLLSNSYISYLYPSIMVGALAAVVIYFFLDCLAYFKTKFWLRFCLGGIALASGIIAGVTAAAATTVILLIIGIIINKHYK